MSIRELSRRFPATRPVLERYGLGDCGGDEGPDEPLAWFATVNGSHSMNSCATSETGVVLTRTTALPAENLWWADAARHTFTIGFLTLLIVG